MRCKETGLPLVEADGLPQSLSRMLCPGLPCYAVRFVDSLSVKEQRRRRVLILTFQRLIVLTAAGDIKRYTRTDQIRRLQRQTVQGNPQVLVQVPAEYDILLEFCDDVRYPNAPPRADAADAFVHAVNTVRSLQEGGLDVWDGVVQHPPGRTSRLFSEEAHLHQAKAVARGYQPPAEVLSRNKGLVEAAVARSADLLPAASSLLGAPPKQLAAPATDHRSGASSPASRPASPPDSPAHEHHHPASPDRDDALDETAALMSALQAVRQPPLADADVLRGLAAAVARAEAAAEDSARAASAATERAEAAERRLESCRCPLPAPPRPPPTWCYLAVPGRKSEFKLRLLRLQRGDGCVVISARSAAAAAVSIPLSSITDLRPEPLQQFPELAFSLVTPEASAVFVAPDAHRRSCWLRWFNDRAARAHPSRSGALGQ